MWLSTPPGWGKKKSLTMAMLYGILRAFQVGDPSRSGLRTEKLHHEHLIHPTGTTMNWAFTSSLANLSSKALKMPAVGARVSAASEFEILILDFHFRSSQLLATHYGFSILQQVYTTAAKIF